MVMVMMVPATRERTNIMSAITARAHILQAVVALPLGVMFVYMEIEVVAKCCIIRHWVVEAAGAAGLAAMPAQVLCGRCSSPFAYGRRVGREARVAALGAGCGVPALTASSAPLAARALSSLFAIGALRWYHPRLVRGDGAGCGTASRRCRNIGSCEEVIESLHND